jgi:hypothetical protein
MNQAALIAAGPELVELGYDLTLATGDKGNRPFLREWQSHAIPSERWEWFASLPQVTGMGIITAGLAVIDLDGKEGLENWIEFLRFNSHIDPAPFRTQMVATPGGGYHLYMQDPYQTVTNAGGVLGPIPKIDVRGTGGFIACPPTQRAGTPGYQWMVGPCSIDQLPPAPDWLAGKVNRAGALVSVSGTWEEQSTEWGEGQMTTIAMRVSKVPAGGRHQALIEAAHAAGHMIAEGNVTMSYAYESLSQAAQLSGLHAEGRGDEVRRTILDGLSNSVRGHVHGLSDILDRIEEVRRDGR